MHIRRTIALVSILVPFYANSDFVPIVPVIFCLITQHHLHACMQDPMHTVTYAKCLVLCLS